MHPQRKILETTKGWNLSEIEFFSKLFSGLLTSFEKSLISVLLKSLFLTGEPGACGMLSSWGVVDFFIDLLFQFLPANIDIELWWVISYKCLTVPATETHGQSQSQSRPPGSQVLEVSSCDGTNIQNRTSHLTSPPSVTSSQAGN